GRRRRFRKRRTSRKPSLGRFVELASAGSCLPAESAHNTMSDRRLALAARTGRLTASAAQYPRVHAAAVRLRHVVHKTGELALERQLELPDLTVTVFDQIDFRDALDELVLAVINLWAVDQQNHVGILLDGATVMTNNTIQQPTRRFRNGQIKNILITSEFNSHDPVPEDVATRGLLQRLIIQYTRILSHQMTRRTPVEIHVLSTCRGRHAHAGYALLLHEEAHSPQHLLRHRIHVSVCFHTN